MKLIQFIRENNINNYETLKTILESETYNLKIKEDNEYPDLFLIHTQNNSAFNIQFVNECNGIILEKNTFKVVCYTFNKCADIDDITNTQIITQNIDLNNLYVENAVEGTLIRLFYYNDKWIVSTKKCIDASKSKWLSEKNFLQLFKECVNNFDFIKNLNNSYCYSFIIMHPENNIVVNYTNPFIYHISTRDLNSLNEIDIDIGIPKNKRNYVEHNNFENTLINMYNDNSLLYEGLIFIDTHYNRLKLKTPYYNKVRGIWGNTNNRFYRYLELRKDSNLLNEYLSYYNNDRNKFIQYEQKIQNLANNILQIYLSKHVHKNNIKIPFFFSKTIYKLHGDFFKDKIKTDYNKVMLTLLELEPKNICFIMNNYEKYIIEQEKITKSESEMEIDY
jgi:hypothetical protein